MKATLVSKKKAERAEARAEAKSRKSLKSTPAEEPDKPDSVKDVKVNPAKMPHVLAKAGQGDRYPDNAAEKAERAELNEAAEDEGDADAAEARSRGDTSEGLDVTVPKKTEKPRTKASLAPKTAKDSTKVVMVRDVETCRAGNITLLDTGYRVLKQGKAYMLPRALAEVIKDAGSGVIADEIEDEVEDDDED